MGYVIILDTNVVSALMQHDPDQLVVTWLDQQQPRNQFYITVITIFEIHYGLQLLPGGKKRERLGEAFKAMLLEDFRARIIEFDTNAAIASAELAAALKQKGQNVDVRDIQIAGIALHTNADIATRNVKDFDHPGLHVINPWETQT